MAVFHSNAPAQVVASIASHPATASHPSQGWVTPSTLIELLVVIAIIGILVGLFVPAVTPGKEKSRRTRIAPRRRTMGL